MGDFLTLDDVLRATEMLREANVPKFDDTHYVVFVGPYQGQCITMMQFDCALLASYRLRLHAYAYFEGASERYFAKKGPMPKAIDCWAKALKLEPYRGQYISRCPEFEDLTA